MKKRVIWTTEGIKTEYIHEKPRAPKEPSGGSGSSGYQHQPGYARPKSAGIGRSKSGQGLNKHHHYHQHQQTHQHHEENVEPRHNYHSSSNQYKERPVPQPVLSSSKAKQHSVENEYAYGSNMYAKDMQQQQKRQQQQVTAGHEDKAKEKAVRDGGGIDDTTEAQGHQGNLQSSASSRIRAAINLGNQFQTHNNVVHEMAALTKDKKVADEDRENSSNVVNTTVAAVTISKTSNEETEKVTREQHAQEALNKKLQGLYTGRPSSANNTANNKDRSSSEEDDEVIVLNNKQPQGGAVATTSVTSTSAGVGVERSGGLGTDNMGGELIGNEKGGIHPTSQSNTHPEISTPSASLELGDRSSMLINGGLSSDLRYGSSIEEAAGATETLQLRLSTLPNQFCSLKEAEELQQLIVSTCKSRGGGYSTSATAGLSNSTALMDMYMVGKIVGVGSYGKVRAAWHRLTGQKVAIKTYDKSKLKDPEHWKRVQSEIKIMEQVSHPRIARMYEAVETPKRMHLIMECLDGGNLCSYVKSKRRLSEDESRRIFFQLVQALDVLHQSCVIHRDIKLENVLFDKNKEVKLIDFGFSTVSPNGKKLRVFCGTPSYMAPEIVRRTEYEGKPVDMWGLGVLLYALLCGCFPFRAKSYPDLYRRIARGTFTIPDELSSPVRDLLTQLLMVDPYARISAANVLKHPWLQLQAMNVPDMVKLQKETPILISERPADDIDDGVINELAEFGIDKDDIVRQVMSKTHSSLATFYYLMLHTVKGGDKRSRGSSSHRQRPHSSNAASNGLVSGGVDLTKKYAISGGFTGYEDGGSSDGNRGQVPGSGSSGGKGHHRPRSASTGRPSSGHSSNGNSTKHHQSGSSGHNRHYSHRPRSASSGRVGGNRY